jgi:hypothetical protein
MLLAALLLCPVPARAHLVTVILPSDVLRDYRAFLDGRDPLDVTDYSGPWSRRDVAEVVLFQQALALGGMTTRPSLRAVGSYARTILELRTGGTVAAATTLWRRDLAGLGKGVLVSPAMVRPGEFEAGLYTAPDNERALGARSLADVRGLSGVCNRQWVPDWEILSGLKLRQLSNAPSWEVMVRMTAEHRADFLLAPFQPTRDLHLTAYGTTLVPVPGLKIGLPGSRHFAVSASHPQGERVYRALVRGLKKMRGRGVITKAYTECGFFNAGTRDWKTLDAKEMEISGR